MFDADSNILLVYGRLDSRLSAPPCDPDLTNIRLIEPQASSSSSIGNNLISNPNEWRQTKKFPFPSIGLIHHYRVAHEHRSSPYETRGQRRERHRLVRSQCLIGLTEYYILNSIRSWAHARFVILLPLLCGPSTDGVLRQLFISTLNVGLTHFESITRLHPRS